MEAMLITAPFVALIAPSQAWVTLKVPCTLTSSVFFQLAAALGLSDAAALIQAADGLRQAAGLPPKLGPLGLHEADFDWIVANSRSGSMKSNPRELSDDDLRLILKQLL